MWDDLVELMAEGVATGRIDTVRPEHTPEAMGRAAAASTTTAARSTSTVGPDSRATSAGNKVRTEVLVGRNLFWCPGCQPRFRSRATHT